MGVFLTPSPDLTPSALLHNLKHNGVLHQTNVIVTVQTAQSPRVPRPSGRNGARSPRVFSGSP